MEVYTDGSRILYTDGFGYAGGGVWFGPNDCRNSSIPIYERDTTHQYAELLAIYYALVYCKNVIHLVICTDSKYSIGCLTEWFPNWQRNGWKNSNNKDVINKEIIQKCLELLKYRDVSKFQTEFRHVFGHKGLEGNEGADKLAKTASQLSAASSIKF